MEGGERADSRSSPASMVVNTVPSRPFPFPLPDSILQQREKKKHAEHERTNQIA